MILSVLLLATGTAFAAPAPKLTAAKAEETLRVSLQKLRQSKIKEMQQNMFSGAEELRDAVSSGSGEVKKKLANRLPGMAKDPFDICRDLTGCREAPQSLHVEDGALIDDALVALARPWLKLQEARGKDIGVVVDPGAGVQLKLEDFPARPVVTLTAEPTPTGGFDVSLEDGAASAKAYAAARAALLKDAPQPAR
jgi:hypothetical protein